MSDGLLTKTGRIKDKFLPAIYFDSSVVIDYWLTEGLTEPEHLSEILLKDNLLYHQNEYIKRLLKTADIRLRKVAEIREKLNFGQAKATAVTSPICLLELVEWYSEANFKQIVSQVVGVMYIQKKSKKEIGDYLVKLLNSFFNDKTKDKARGDLILFMDTMLNPSFAESHGLQGLVQADIVNFSISPSLALHETPISMCSYAQVGAADIMHILFAIHLGCKYIASFDDDFKRVKNLIPTGIGITILSSPEEILNIL